MELLMPSRMSAADSPRERELVVAVQRARSASERAFEPVYALHYRDVYRYVLGLTRSPADAEEIAAETFERALRAWSRVPEPPLPWLLLTARRIATDRWRRTRRLAQIALGMRGRSSADAGERQTEFWLWYLPLSTVVERASVH